MRTLAVIPARSGSKRVPGKNIRTFAGKPLIAWSIEFAQSVAQFEKLVVSTDSEEIAQVARREGVNISYLRPPELSTDTSKTIDAVLHALDLEAADGRQYDLVALLQPTSPIRLLARWNSAFSAVAGAHCEAAIGIAPVRDHPYHVYKLTAEGLMTPFVAGGEDLRRTRSQDLPPAHRIAGNLYLVRTQILRDLGTFFPPRSVGIVCDDPVEDLDIDTETDWQIAESLVSAYLLAPS